jgi:hypothetical protein
MSASTEIKIAEKFFETHSHGDLLPVILKIHVINMTEKYLTLYTEMFSSVVSTIYEFRIICPVFPDENDTFPNFFHSPV